MQKFGKFQNTKIQIFSEISRNLPKFRETLLSETDRNFAKQISSFGSNPNYTYMYYIHISDILYEITLSISGNFFLWLLGPSYINIIFFMLITDIQKHILFFSGVKGGVGQIIIFSNISDKNLINKCQFCHIKKEVLGELAKIINSSLLLVYSNINFLVLLQKDIFFRGGGNGFFVLFL